MPSVETPGLDPSAPHPFLVTLMRRHPAGYVADPRRETALDRAIALWAEGRMEEGAPGPKVPVPTPTPKVPRTVPSQFPAMPDSWLERASAEPRVRAVVRALEAWTRDGRGGDPRLGSEPDAPRLSESPWYPQALQVVRVWWAGGGDPETPILWDAPDPLVAALKAWEGDPENTAQPAADRRSLDQAVAADQTEAFVAAVLAQNTDEVARLAPHVHRHAPVYELLKAAATQGRADLIALVQDHVDTQGMRVDPLQIALNHNRFDAVTELAKGFVPASRAEHEVLLDWAVTHGHGPLFDRLMELPDGPQGVELTEIAVAAIRFGRADMAARLAPRTDPAQVLQRVSDDILKASPHDHRAAENQGPFFPEPEDALAVRVDRGLNAFAAALGPALPPTVAELAAATQRELAQKRTAWPLPSPLKITGLRILGFGDDANTPPRPLRVVIADPHPLLTQILQSELDASRRARELAEAQAFSDRLATSGLTREQLLELGREMDAFNQAIHLGVNERLLNRGFGAASPAAASVRDGLIRDLGRYRAAQNTPVPSSVPPVSPTLGARIEARRAQASMAPAATAVESVRARPRA